MLIIQSLLSLIQSSLAVVHSTRHLVQDLPTSAFAHDSWRKLRSSKPMISKGTKLRLKPSNSLKLKFCFIILANLHMKQTSQNFPSLETWSSWARNPPPWSMILPTTFSCHSLSYDIRSIYASRLKRIY